MNRKQIAEILSRELECVRRHDTPRCNDKDCIHCDLVLDADIIIEAYTEAITLMQNNDWHYPSKGEYPTESGRYLCATDCYYETRVETVYYSAEAEQWGSMNKVIAWMPLPEPPKEEA